MIEIKSAKNQPVWVRENLIKNNPAMQKTNLSLTKLS